MQNDTIFRLARGENFSRTMNPGREGAGGYDVNRTDINRWIGTWIPGYDTDTSSTPFTRTFMFVDPSENTLQRTYRLYVSSSDSAARTLYMNRTVNSAGTTNYEVGITSVMIQEIV